MMLVGLDGYWRDRGGERAEPFGFRLSIADDQVMPEGNRREQSKGAFRNVGAFFF
jgi:uncharacterized protein